MNEVLIIMGKYKEVLEKAKTLYNMLNDKGEKSHLEELFPELKSEDERIRKALINYFEDNGVSKVGQIPIDNVNARLEKQGSEPNWYHHKVDLSDCSEEYRKAYYDGWNNCNMQHSQYKSESNDVVKCLINGMKFYYEDNEEATWGTEKFSMKVKDILSWLEKQGEHHIACNEEQLKVLNEVLNFAANHESPYWNDYIFGILNSLIKQLKKLKV